MLAGPNFEGECVLTADLDLAESARGKYDFDVAGHYARPDVFRLHVNPRPARAVVSDAEAPGDLAAPVEWAGEETASRPSSPPL